MLGEWQAEGDIIQSSLVNVTQLVGFAEDS